MLALSQTAKAKGQRGLKASEQSRGLPTDISTSKRGTQGTNERARGVMDAPLANRGKSRVLSWKGWHGSPGRGTEAD